jgi:Protein of unknown function (DUF3866)
MLALRRGVVLAAGDPAGPMQRLDVRLGGERRTALADVALVGAARVGDEVVVNLAGPDLVHVNLTRGLDAPTVPGVQPLKLASTSLQHPFEPVEESARPLQLPTGAPVGVVLSHGQLAPLAWAFARAAPGGRLGYIQTGGGALPGGLSETVRILRERGLLAAHLTAGPAYGGEADATTTAGALQHGFAERFWHAAVCGPGPALTAPSRGHGAGMVALEAAHAAAAIGCRVVICPGGRVVPHEARMLLELALVPFTVAHAGERPRAGFGRHEWRQGEADLDGYAAAGLPAHAIEDDPDRFAAALAAGGVLAQSAA